MGSAPLPHPVAAVSSTRAVERALTLLAEVCADESLSLAECSRRTGLPASTALRLLRTLEHTGFVSRDHAGSFAAGPRIIQIGASAFGRQSLVRLAEPALNRIVEATGETAYLSIAGPADTAIYLAMVEGTHAIRHTGWVGLSLDVAGLAVGRVLAGEVPEVGYLAERDAVEPDVTAIVAPVLRPGGVVAALSVLGPTYRIDEHAMLTFGQIVVREADGLAGRLGRLDKPPHPARGAHGEAVRR